MMPPPPGMPGMMGPPAGMGMGGPPGMPGYDPYGAQVRESVGREGCVGCGEGRMCGEGEDVRGVGQGGCFGEDVWGRKAGGRGRLEHMREDRGG